MTREQAEGIEELAIGDIVTLKEHGQFYLAVDPKTRKVAHPQRPQPFRVTAVAPIKLEAIHDAK